ncbi:hypothetical protein ACVW07_002616 [Cellulomonas sp. URHB0016]
MTRCGSPASSGRPDAVRDPCSAHALLPAVGSCAVPPVPSGTRTDARSGPTVRSTWSCHSSRGNDENSACATCSTPSGAHTGHGSASTTSPNRSSSAVVSGVPPDDASPSRTPSTYAATQSWTSPGCASKARRAVSASRARRANRSHSTPAAPRCSARRPSARHRPTWICQPRSSAVTRPWARARARWPVARTCGMPQASRNSSAPCSSGSGGPSGSGGVGRSSPLRAAVIGARSGRRSFPRGSGSPAGTTGTTGTTTARARRRLPDEVPDSARPNLLSSGSPSTPAAHAAPLLPPGPAGRHRGRARRGGPAPARPPPGERRLPRGHRDGARPGPRHAQDRGLRGARAGAGQPWGR